MSQTPYLSQELKDYLKFHKIETTLSNTVNELLRKQYEDPYSYMMNEFGNLASNDIKILGIKAIQGIDNQGNPTIKCIFKIEYKLKTHEILADTQSQIGNTENPKILYDQDESGKDTLQMQQALKIINEDVNKLIQNKIASDQKSIDDGLQKIYEQNNQNCLNVTQPVSYGVPQVISKIFHQQPYEIIRKYTGYNPENNAIENQPKIMVNLLQGSKVANVKCKVYKFYLIIKSYQNPQQVIDIASEIVHNIKKSICSGKQGEAALKYFNDGTFICSVDTIADNIKQIEEAIGKTNYKDNVALGISWMADNLFNADKKAYELENPKQLFDTDQLIDYYLKLAKDKPIIEYMEDPIQSEDQEGWFKCIEKFKEANIQIGSRQIYSDLQAIQDLVDPLLPENYPDLSPEELEVKNQQRVILSCSQFKPYEYPTISKFVELMKIIQQKVNNFTIIICDSITDTTDTSIIDLAYSLKNVYINLPPPIKFEKLIKYNRYAEIQVLQQIKEQ